MILSPREQDSVREVASSYNIDGDPEVLVDEALQAICLGQADATAYAVGRAAGIEFIGDFIWGKDRRKIVRADQARALIAQAKQDQTYEGPIPEDDGKAVEEANALVELATDAWNDMVRGSEVETILRMAAQFESDNGDAPEAQAEAPAEEQPKASARLDADPEQPVQDARPDLVETSPAVFRTDDLDELAKIEPWEDYGNEKVGDIVNGINAAIETYDLEELYELLRNIWAFESSHRNRKTVLDAIQEVHEQIVEAQRAEGATPYAPPNQVQRETEEQPSAPEGEAEPPAEDDEEPEPAEEDEGGEGDGAEVPDADREPEPDAEPEPAGEAPEPASEGPVDEAEPVAEGGADDVYTGLIAEVEEAIARERMHIPSPPTEQAPEVPWDWTKMSDQELQRLYGVFSGFGYYVDYRYARENRIALLCKQAADEMARDLLVASVKYDEKGKEIKVTDREAAIESDENVKLWRKRQRRHEAFASALRSEREGYYKLLENLSRHESMRQDEWQRSGGKSGSILRRAGGK